MEKSKLYDYMITRQRLEKLSSDYYKSGTIETIGDKEPGSATKEYISRYIELDLKRREILPDLQEYLHEVLQRDPQVYRSLYYYFFGTYSLADACKKTDPVYTQQLLRRTREMLTRTLK